MTHGGNPRSLRRANSFPNGGTEFLVFHATFFPAPYKLSIHALNDPFFFVKEGSINGPDIVKNVSHE